VFIYTKQFIKILSYSKMGVCVNCLFELLLPAELSLKF
jgi:hypothetical protein